MNLEESESHLCVAVTMSEREAFRVVSPSKGLAGSYLLLRILGENSGKSTETFRQTIHVLLCPCYENFCGQIYSDV